LSEKTLNVLDIIEKNKSVIGIIILFIGFVVQYTKQESKVETNQEKFLENIERRITKVRGDFRQKEIIKIWTKKLPSLKEQSFYIANLKIKCSSGTYVRTIADSLGTKIDIPALAFSIKRTKVGKYSI
jgi:tRNA pseudouridine55 synthase